MLYTSSTTGTPKGVARPIAGDRPPGSVFLIRPLMRRMGFDENTVMVSPAPLYHSAPLGYSMGVHRLGGTVVISSKFDAARCLATTQSFRATHGLFVPTMFARMLRVPGRANYDLSSLVAAVHGAAPCPTPVKQAMIDWWGPVLYEYYAGTEGAGMTLIDSQEWAAHPGSVGRPVSGAVHILDDEGNELPPGKSGAVYFSGGTQFRYHGDTSKTAAAYGPHGWNTMGDIGHLDRDGYLYLTDRKAFTVISGGVNIYPQEAEDVLAGHSGVADVAPFGVPDPDLGEALITVVQLTEPNDASDETARELWQWCADRLARQKCPRAIKFRHSLPQAEERQTVQAQPARRVPRRAPRKRVMSCGTWSSYGRTRRRGPHTRMTEQSKKALHRPTATSRRPPDWGDQEILPSRDPHFAPAPTHPPKFLPQIGADRPTRSTIRSPP